MYSTILSDFQKLQTLRFANFFTKFLSLPPFLLFWDIPHFQVGYIRPPDAPRPIARTEQYFIDYKKANLKNCPLIRMHSTIFSDFQKSQTLCFADFFTRFPSLRIMSSLYFRFLFFSVLPIGNDNTKTPFSRISFSRI